MTTHIFAIGRIDKSGIDVVLSPQQVAEFLDAYDMGMLDAEEGFDCDPLKWFSDLARIEQYILGYRAGQKGEG